MTGYTGTFTLTAYYLLICDVVIMYQKKTEEGCPKKLPMNTNNHHTEHRLLDTGLLGSDR